MSDFEKHVVTIRKGVCADVTIPTDITMEEAHVIADFIRSLAIKNQPPKGKK